MPLSEVDTPALLIDLDVFEQNLQRMAAAAAKYSVRLRPHAKTHKCPVIAMRQIALGAVGVCCQKVSEAQSNVYSELQAGSYIFMDRDYAFNLDEKGQGVSDFGHSLFVYATVMSKPHPERAVLDAGLKASSIDSGLPAVVGYPGLRYVRAADEHGTLEISQPDCPIGIGDKIRLIPGHCDPTVNLHDWYVGFRNGRVEAIWPIAARGALF
jgi:D-serine deaminase-like pyridoxal phosphate-dependent protein